MHIVIANYGNESLALLQWIDEHKLTEVTVLTVDTGWGSQHWRERLAAGQAFAKRCGFTPIVLQPAAQFAALVRERQQFPSPKFQWCSSILKGLPILEWLDDADPACTASILLGTRRASSHGTQGLTEFVKESEHFGERRLWHPLYQHTDAERNALIERTGFSILPHKSDECAPCVNSHAGDILRLDTADIAKATALEQAIGHSFAERDFNPTHFPLDQLVASLKAKTNTHKEATNTETRFDMGCGSTYGCGQ